MARMTTSWGWKAVLCSTMAVSGGGCGRVATLPDDTVDASTVAAGAGGASTIEAGAGGASTIEAGASGASTEAAGADGGAAPPGPFTAWMPCQTLTTERPPRAPHALAVSADLRWLAILDTPLHYPGDPSVGDPSSDDPTSSHEYQSVALWNLPSSAVALRLTNVDFGYDVALSPDGALVAISGDGAQVTSTRGSGALALSDSQITWGFPPPPDIPTVGSWVRNLAFSPDGSLLASGQAYGVDLFRTESGASVDKLVAKASSPGVAFSPDGLYLASSAPSLWRVADRVAIWAPQVSDPSAACAQSCVTDNWATFSPDGTLLLTQSAKFFESNSTELTWDTLTNLFDAASGAPLRSLSGDLPRRPTFSPDGRWILAGDRLIDVKSGNESALGVPAVVSLFLSDGRIAIADASGAVSLLCPLPP
jgi:WD40 repeat protein